MTISLLVPRLPKTPNQCYSNGPGIMGSLDSNKNIQPVSVEIYIAVIMVLCVFCDGHCIKKIVLKYDLIAWHTAVII